MKCDRYIGTGASNSQKEIRSKSIACSPKSSKHRPLDSVNSDSEIDHSCKGYLKVPGHIDSRKGSLQVPSANDRRLTVHSSSTRSSVLIPDVLSDLRKSDAKEDTFRENGNCCIVIELHELKNNATEINDTGIDQGNDVHAKLSTSIKEYQVNNISSNKILYISFK